MSSTVKPTESKKPKNSTYQNSNNMNFNSSKNSKLVFTTTSKNKKIPHQTNSAKKRHSKNQYFPQHEKNNTDIMNDSLILEKKGVHKQDKKINNEDDMKENQNINDKRDTFKEDDIQSKKVLKSVDSFTSIGFLLPNKSNNIDKTDRKTSNKKRNRRYGGQEDYDYDGNILYSNPHFGMESSGKKRKITPGHAKNVNINIDTDSSNDEEIDKLKKQEELIKKLMKYKNFRHFIKKILKHKKYEIDTKGKLIGWSDFKINLYKISFLDLYYRHRLPFIIMRPRLDVIKRKREERQRQMKEKIKMEEETKENGGSHDKGSIEIKEGETTYASVLDKNIQNEMEKNGYIIGEDYNTVRIEKRESLFPTKDGKQRSIFTLTKIPQKTGDDDNSGNIRLKMAFNKAKDAARVVRRLQYSYSMRVNILLSKPIFQKNVKIIQNWYRSIKFIKINTPKIIKIQAFVRGMMIRKAFKEVRNLYERILPFIYEIDKVISRKFAILLFDKLIPRYGLHTIIKLAKIKNNKIINALSKYVEKQKLKKETYSLSTKIKNKCCYTKETFDYPTRTKLLKLQSYIKSYLMLNNEKIMLKYANEYNPKLYYYLKYGKNKDLLRKKLKKLREYVLKFKELKLRAKYKELNINNKYDYLNYILRKRVFNKLKQYYKDSINNKDSNYQTKLKLKMLLIHQKKKNNIRLLKKYFNKWNIKANYLSEYRNILKQDKLLLIEAIMKYHKKYEEKVFMLLLNSINEKKKENENKSANTLLEYYSKYNKKYDKAYINNILLRTIKSWKKKAKLISITKACNMINKNVKIYLANKKLKQKQKLINCLNIRNKVFKEKLKLWKFNAGKLRHHYHSFINKTLGIVKMRKKLESLKKNITSLESRKKNYLKKYFERFQTNTGVKKLLCINLQFCLYDENKQIIMDDKYSMMKYIKDQHNINKEELKNKVTLKAIFKFWKGKQRISDFKKKMGQRIKSKCEYEKSMVKLKFIRWFKINKMQKVEDACRLIQRKYRNYKKEKSEKKI